MENNTQLHKQNDQICRKNKLMLSMEEVVSPDELYIISISGTQSESEFRIGAVLSNYSCVIYSIGESLSRTITLDHNQAPIVGLKFSSTSRDLLYIANGDGLITACDLRANGKVVMEFKDTTEDNKMKPLASFDIGYNDRLIAGGTEHIGGDSFILFWDIRKYNSKINDKNSLLGGYWESHTDDITCLSFHPVKQTVLASGSTDGLINVFDLTQSSEDLALMYSFNTESSVDRLGWFNDSLWCTTHTYALQLWNCEDANAYATFSRNQFAMSQNDKPDDCYVVKFHPTNTFEQSFVLAGSSTAEGEKLRCLNVANNRLEILYEIIGNKQVVRDSWIHEKSGCLVTGGESGIINVWRQTESAEQTTDNNTN